MNDREQPPLSDSVNRHPNRTGTPPLLPPAGTLTLCLLTLLTAVIQSIWDGQRIARALGFDPANFITHPSPNGHEQLVPGWLALFTYVFPHGGWGHVLPNTIALWVFGAFVESNIGTRKFVVGYFDSRDRLGLNSNTLAHPAHHSCETRSRLLDRLSFPSLSCHVAGSSHFSAPFAIAFRSLFAYSFLSSLKSGDRLPKRAAR